MSSVRSINYEVCHYEKGQDCFGSGCWVIQQTVVKDIAATQTREEAIAIINKMRLADRVES